MLVSLAEAKTYLKMDDITDDDGIIQDCLDKAHEIAMAVSRLETAEFEAASTSTKIAVLYALGYLYQNRENADHLELTKTLRALLSDVRKEAF